MFERLTDRARKVMAIASQEAKRLNHEYVAPEHILIALVTEGAGVAANVLKNLDIDARKVRLQVEQLLKRGPEMITMGKLPQTPGAKKALEYAIEEATAMNHSYAGTEHLLLGLLRDEDGNAAKVLLNLGLAPERVREQVLDLLGINEQDASSAGHHGAPLALEIYIDPGDGSVETIRDVLLRLSDLHVAAGGLGLQFKSDGLLVRAMEGVTT